MSAEAARLAALDAAESADLDGDSENIAALVAPKPASQSFTARPVGWRRPRWWSPVFERVEACYLLPKFVLERIARASWPDEFTREPPKKYTKTPEQRARWNAAQAARRRRKKLDAEIVKLAREHNAIVESEARLAAAELPTADLQ